MWSIFNTLLFGSENCFKWISTKSHGKKHFSETSNALAGSPYSLKQWKINKLDLCVLSNSMLCWDHEEEKNE